MLQRQVLTSQRHVDIIQRRILPDGGERGEIFLSYRTQPCRSYRFQSQVQALATQLQVDFALICFQVAPDLTAGSSGTRKGEPVACGVRRTICDNLDDLAAFE